MKITNRELVRRINELPPERLDDDVSVFVSATRETYPANDAGTVLRVDHPDDLLCGLDYGHFAITI